MKRFFLALSTISIVTGCGGTHESAHQSVASSAPRVVTNPIADAETTRKIRMDIADDPEFSTEARNLYIRTENGQVTFRGAIASDFERARVQDIAAGYAGANNVSGITTIVPDAVASEFERDPIHVTALKPHEGFE